MTNSVLIAYVIFSIVITSASFRIAVTNISFSILFLVSIYYLLQKRYLILNTTEKLIYILLIWLILICLINPNPLSGIAFVLSEYRLLWSAPLIAAALRGNLIKTQIYFPPIIGSLINLLGSTFLSLKLIGATSVATLLEIGHAAGSKYSLDGKFVQGWLLTVWAGTILSILTFADKRFSQMARLSLFAVLFFATTHAYFIVNSRSGLIGLLVSFLILLLIKSKIKTTKCTSNIRLHYLIGTGALVVFYFVTAEHIGRVQDLLTMLVNSDIEPLLSSSIGQRIIVWSNVFSIDFGNALVGVGGNWEKVMMMWFEQGTLSANYLKWKDFHSEMIWLIVVGGAIALILYILIAVSVLIEAVSLIKRNSLVVGGLGVSIFVIFIVLGSFNSVFQALRESHIVGLALIIWLTLCKQDIQ